MSFNIDPKKVEQRKLARKEATELIGMLESYSIGTPEYEEAFWEEIRKSFPAWLAKPSPPSPDSVPMEEIEAIEFEEHMTFPHGKFEGSTVGQVPEWYIGWWWDTSNSRFTKALRRYMLSERYKKRVREAGE